MAPPLQLHRRPAMQYCPGPHIAADVRCIASASFSGAE
jgi:hypothetical protein